MGIYMGVYNAAEHLKTTKIGNAIYGILDDIGIRAGINRFNFWLKRNDIINPDEVRRNAEHWEKYSDEIDDICGLLADDLSKRVLKGMIKYRCSALYKDLPTNAIRTQYFVNDFFIYGENETYIDGGRLMVIRH